jgi:hypothetical protein
MVTGTLAEWLSVLVVSPPVQFSIFNLAKEKQVSIFWRAEKAARCR